MSKDTKASNISTGDHILDFTQFCSHICNNPFIDDDIRFEIIASGIHQRISRGLHDFLDPKCPQTRRFLDGFHVVIQQVPKDQQSRMLSHMTRNFLSIVHPSMLCLQKNTTSSAETRSIAPTDNPTLSQKEHISAILASNNFAEGKSSKNTENHYGIGRSIWTVAETSKQMFNDLATAVESLGPCCTVIRSGITGELIPHSWFSREYRCYVKRCRVRYLITSPIDDLGSGPAFLYLLTSKSHEGHLPVTWSAWYEYRVAKDRKKGEWDCENYKMQPGLPPTFQLFVQQCFLHNPRCTPKQVALSLEHSHGQHVVLTLGPQATSIVSEQVKYALRIIRNKSETKGKQKRITFMGDIAEYIQRYSVDWKRLTTSGWTPKRIFGEAWTMSAAIELRLRGVIKPFSPGSVKPHRDLIVLDCDEVERDDHWQYLYLSPEQKHRTGPDPRRRTVVFTSFALLTNLVSSEAANWKLCASIDGTHSVAQSDYKLLCFGVMGVSEKGKRSFYPVVYGFGEGEREIVALHMLLNLKFAIERLFGLKDIRFQGGIICDRSAALVNCLRYVFPSSPLLQCYTHIIRKFINPGERGGNGDYKRHLAVNSCEWLSTVAQNDVRCLHQCQSREQFMQMWECVREAWTSAGEGKMATTFFHSYVEDPNFNQWYYMVSGVPGCVPDNNPIESHNRLVKGTPDFVGYITSGRSMSSILNVEFPQLVETSSIERVSPIFAYPILNFERAFKNAEFMSFWEQFDVNTDSRAYRNGWLSNDLHYLSIKITDESVQRMEAAMKGTLQVKMEDRNEIRDATWRFHFTTREQHPIDPNQTYCACSCYRYYYEGWCYNAALFQHQGRLEKDGKRFPASKRRRNQITRKVKDQVALKHALVRKRGMKIQVLEQALSKKQCAPMQQKDLHANLQKTTDTYDDVSIVDVGL